MIKKKIQTLDGKKEVKSSHRESTLSLIIKFSLLGSVVVSKSVFFSLASSKLSIISVCSSVFGLLFIASAASLPKLPSCIPAELGLTSFLGAQEIISMEK